MTVTYVVQYFQERGIRLTIYCLQLYCNVFETLHHLGMKEKRRWIHLLEPWFILLGNHRRELVGIAYHQQLNPSERLAVMPVPAHHRIYGIQQIGPDH